MSALPEAEQRFTELIGRYARLIRSAVIKVSGPRASELGDEIEQRVAEALWKQLRAQQSIAHPAAYIYRCAVRETVRAIQYELDRPTTSIDAGAPAPAGASPEEQARATELERATRDALDNISPDRAKAVRAHLVGFDVEEIMRMHDWSYQKARNLIARGLADLRRTLENKGFHER